MAAEFVGSLHHDRIRAGMPASSLTTDTSFPAGRANDFVFAGVFARLVETIGSEGGCSIGHQHEWEVRERCCCCRRGSCNVDSHCWHDWRWRRASRWGIRRSRGRSLAVGAAYSGAAHVFVSRDLRAGRERDGRSGRNRRTERCVSTPILSRVTAGQEPRVIRLACRRGRARGCGWGGSPKQEANETPIDEVSLEGLSLRATERPW